MAHKYVVRIALDMVDMFLISEQTEMEAGGFPFPSMRSFKFITKSIWDQLYYIHKCVLVKLRHIKPSLMGRYTMYWDPATLNHTGITDI